MKLTKHEIDLIFHQFFRADFTEQPYKKQAEDILSYLYLWEVDDEIETNVSEKRRDYLTTIYLRAYCGCENERYLDELTQSWVEIETHDNGCLIKRYPIHQDLSERTLKRRSFREKMLDDRGWSLLEERLHG